MAAARRRFKGDTGDVRAARDFVRSTLQGRVPQHDLDTTLLVVSELTTNAIVHVGGAFEVDVHADGTVVVAVADSDPTPPIRKQPGPHEPSGRGILILERVCHRWGVKVRRDGKHVWCELQASGNGTRPRAAGR